MRADSTSCNTRMLVAEAEPLTVKHILITRSYRREFFPPARLIDEQSDPNRRFAVFGIPKESGRNARVPAVRGHPGFHADVAAGRGHHASAIHHSCAVRIGR